MSAESVPSPQPELSSFQRVNARLTRIEANLGTENNEATIFTFPSSEFTDTAAVSETVSTEPESQDRFLIRTADRVATLADRFADSMQGRSTPSEFAANKVETGKQIGRQVGELAIGSILIAGAAANSGYTRTKEAGVNKMESFKNFLQQKAEIARSRKNDLIASLTARKNQFRTAAAEKIEFAKERITTSKDRTVLAAQIGRGVLGYSGLALLEAGHSASSKLEDFVDRSADKAASQAYKAKTQAGKGLKLAHGTTVHLRANAYEAKVERTDKREERKLLKQAHTMNKARDLRGRADSLRKTA